MKDFWKKSNSSLPLDQGFSTWAQLVDVLTHNYLSWTGIRVFLRIPRWLAASLALAQQTPVAHKHKHTHTWHTRTPPWPLVLHKTKNIYKYCQMSLQGKITLDWEPPLQISSLTELPKRKPIKIDLKRSMSHIVIWKSTWSLHICENNFFF